jgi:HAE1 family hydrophobic/amphiphilic exporter-1
MTVHPIETFVQNPVKVAVGVLLVALFGVIGLIRMPMQLTPEVQRPTISVRTSWPGASPQEVEREIVREQEEELQSVEGVIKMSSECTDSRGTITMEFLVGTDMEEALVKVNSRLQQVSDYPEDAKEPVISTSNSSDRPIAWFILTTRPTPPEEMRAFRDKVRATNPQLAADLDMVLSSSNPGLANLRLERVAAAHPEAKELLPPEIDIPKLRKFAETNIEQYLERVEGVADCNIYGGEQPELKVIVDPSKLSARQLTIRDVREALRAQNKDTSGGDFWEDKRRWNVRTLGQFRSPEQVANQILAVHDGAPVYVEDVAEVKLDFKKPEGFVRRYGKSSISVNAQRETGANVLDVMQGLQEKVAILNQGVLKDRDLMLTQVYDETEYIKSAVGLVNQNIVVGGCLTVIVLLVFLRSGRSTLVIGLAIPTSIVGTLMVLHVLGRSLNVISLAGLAFAVGMLVDNAVVVLENIYRHYQAGDSPFEAAVRGTQEVWGAVVASTMTTLAVFLPVIFIQEEAGQLFRDIALAISAAVALSLVVSVTVIPTAAARILRRQDEAGHDVTSTRATDRHRRGRWADFLNWIDSLGTWFVDWIVRFNAGVQRSLTNRLMVVVLLVGAASLFTWLAWPKVEYLPTGNRNLVFAVILPPPGYNLGELERIGELVEQALQPYWDVTSGKTSVGDGEYPAIKDFFYVARGRQVFVGLRSADPTRAAELVPMVQELEELIPGSIVVANQSSLFERGLGASRSIDVEITGDHIEDLVRIGEVFMRGYQPKKSQDPSENSGGDSAPAVSIPSVASVLDRGPGQESQARPVPSLDLSSPELHVKPRLVQGRELGVSAVDLGYAVSALVDGAYATDYYVGSEKIDLVIVGHEDSVKRTQDLESLPLATATGQLVPLGVLADVELASGPEQINHRERQRAITISITPPPAMALEDAIDKLQSQIISPLRRSPLMKPDCNITLSGAADKLQQTWLSFRWVMLLALLITYLLMAALFESWVYPFVIILSVPLGAVGGILGLKMLGYYLIVQGDSPQTLDVLTMLGFVILIGTVVNNAILIVHQSLNQMRFDHLSPSEAILTSVRTRVRPIFMTTATTVFGLAPLVFYPGAGSELYRGLGSVVLGGLLVSTIFTLVLVPTLFSLMMELKSYLQRRLTNWRNSSRPPREPEDTEVMQDTEVDNLSPSTRSVSSAIE